MKKPNPANRYMGKPCSRGHSGERYLSSRKCCECQREQLHAAYRAFQKRRGLTKPERAALARDKARAVGKLFFFGQPCRKAGHNGKRHTSTGACWYCGWARRPSLRTLPRKDHEHILRLQRERGRRATRALRVLRELGLRL
jgi:hypothetical protein